MYFCFSQVKNSKKLGYGIVVKISNYGFSIQWTLQCPKYVYKHFLPK